jgi:hypothetical protein
VNTKNKNCNRQGEITMREKREEKQKENRMEEDK